MRVSTHFLFCFGLFVFSFCQCGSAQDSTIKVTSYGLALPKNNVTLRANTGSYVRKVVVREGQRVKKGDVLIELDWVAAKAKKKVAELTAMEEGGILRAQAEWEFAKANFERIQRLGKTNAINRDELEESLLRLKTAEAQLKTAQETKAVNLARLELAEAELEDYFIRSPFDGEVVHLSVSEGSVVNNNTDVVQLIDSDVLYVDLYVPIKEALKLKTGSVCQLNVREPFPGKTLDAELVFRSSIIEATTSGSVRVTFEVDNREHKLPAGFAVELKRLPSGQSSSHDLDSKPNARRDLTQ